MDSTLPPSRDRGRAITTATATVPGMATTKIVFAAGAEIAVEGTADEVQGKISRGRADLAQFKTADGRDLDVYVVAANVAYVEQTGDDDRTAI
jgi:hypothetical protein